MLGEDVLKGAAQRAVEMGAAAGRQVEVTVVAKDAQLTRFANNEIHQHVAERDVTVHVRVATGQKVGAAAANGLDDETLRRTVEQAATVAALQRENPDFPGFPGPFHPEGQTAACRQSTLQATPEARADVVGAVCGRAQAVGFVAAGACSTSLTEVALANSLGTAAYEARTHARLLAVVTGETSSGYGMRQGADFAALDAAGVAAEATAKAERGRNPQDLEPGEYDVVLEPYAAEDVIGFVAALGLQGRSVLEKTSFATGKLGERLLSEHVTLRDEPFAAAGLIRSFDAEGVPKRPLTLVDSGVVAAVTYDSLTAAKAGTETTGHALPGGSMYGPVATNLSLVPGTQTRDQLIGSIQRGLLVTRFWYTRTVHPLSVTVTGMTRDSTFLIENGRVTRPVKNLRFTMSYVKALQRVIGVGSDAVLAGDAGAPVLTPAVAIRAFAFTGKSEY
jgi:predicted Zn-dependent protease